MSGGKYKLYVWEDFCRDYTGGLAVAIATSKEEAEQLVIKECGWEPQVYNWGVLSIYPVNCPIAKKVYGGQ